MNFFNLDEKRFSNFLMSIESQYLPNPYHNNMHAADVVQTLNSFLAKVSVCSWFRMHCLCALRFRVASPPSSQRQSSLASLSRPSCTMLDIQARTTHSMWVARCVEFDSVFAIDNCLRQTLYQSSPSDTTISRSWKISMLQLPFSYLNPQNMIS